MLQRSAIEHARRWRLEVFQMDGFASAQAAYHDLLGTLKLPGFARDDPGVMSIIGMIEEEWERICQQRMRARDQADGMREQFLTTTPFTEAITKLSRYRTLLGGLPGSDTIVTSAYLSDIRTEIYENSRIAGLSLPSPRNVHHGTGHSQPLSALITWIVAREQNLSTATDEAGHDCVAELQAWWSNTIGDAPCWLTGYALHYLINNTSV